MSVTFPKPRVILTDIEGTTTPIRFVKEVLFPFARARLATYVRAHAQDDAVKDILRRTAAEAPAASDLDGAISALLGWSDADMKIGPLKSLQGLIWEEGYRSGALRSPMFRDAAEGLQRWSQDGILLAVYSSGSVLAQKQLFGHSDHGDLAKLFAAFFDTAVGAKRDAIAYAKIADALQVPAGGILFLSDIPEELDAAKSAGMATTHLVRPGEGSAITDRHPAIASFAEIGWR